MNWNSAGGVCKTRFSNSGDLPEISNWNNHIFLRFNDKIELGGGNEYSDVELNGDI
jgi:hypothetical protein